MRRREGFRFHRAYITFRKEDTLPGASWPRMDWQLLIGGDKEGDFVIAVQNSFGLGAAASEF